MAAPPRKSRRSRRTRAPASRPGSTPTATPTRQRDELLRSADAARRLGLTERRLRQLVAEHADTARPVPSQGHGADRRFPWPALREWRDEDLRQQGVRSVRPQSIEEARARKLTAEADLAEIELAERRAQLVPAAVFRQEYEAACARLRAAQLNAPARYAPQLLELFGKRLRAEDLRRIEDFFGRMVREMMRELEAGEDIPEDEEPAGGLAPGGPLSA